MEIEKAIEILNDLLGEGPQYPPNDRREAVELGIEALTRIITSRHSKHHNYKRRLPGETE